MLVVVEPVRVVVVGIFLRVREPCEPVAALCPRAVQRLVLDELARVVFRLALDASHVGGNASCIGLFLVMNDIVMAHLQARRRTRQE